MLDSLLNRTKLTQKLENFTKNRFYGKISANQMTLLGLFTGLITAIVLFLITFFNLSYYWNILVAFLMAFSFLFDVLDGSLARLENPTKFGGILDIMCDRMVEISVILALTYRNPDEMVWISLVLLSAIILCMTIFLLVGNAARAHSKEKPEKVIFYSGGITERGETFIFLILAVLIPWYQAIILSIFTVLILITTCQRFLYAYKILN